MMAEKLAVYRVAVLNTQALREEYARKIAEGTPMTYRYVYGAEKEEERCRQDCLRSATWWSR